MIAAPTRRIAAIAAIVAAASCRTPSPYPETAWGVVPIIGTGFRAPHPERGPWIEMVRRAIAYARVDAYTGFGYIARPGAVADFFDAGVDARLAELSVPGRRLVAFLDLIPPPDGASEIETPRLWEEATLILGAAAVQLSSRGIAWLLLGDEPNSTGEPDWAPRYMERLRRAYAIIHKNAPESAVIAGNIAGGDPEALRALYREGLAEVSDAVGYHPRASGVQWFPLRDAQGAARIVLEDDRPEKPLFFGRGWGPPNVRVLPHHDIPIDAELLVAIRQHLVEGLRAMRSLRSPVLGALFHPFNDSYTELRNGRLSFNDLGLTDIWANAKDDLLDLFPGDRPSLANPGFELAPFDAEGAWTVEGEARAIESVAHAGSRCVRLAPGAAIRQETVPASVAAGTSVELRLFLRAEAAETAAAEIALAFLGARGEVLATTARTRTVEAAGGDAGGRWTYAFVRATAPPGGDRAAAIVRHASGGAILADDLLLYEGLPPRRLASASVLVRDDRGGPIANARVRIGAQEADTDEIGQALVYGVEPGAHDVTCSAPGFRTERLRDQILRADRQRPVHFVLIAQSPRLPARFEAVATGVSGEIEIRFDPPAPETGRFAIIREGPGGRVTLEIPPEDAAAGLVRDAGLEDGTLYLYCPCLRPEGQDWDLLGPARGAVPRTRDRVPSGSAGPAPRSSGGSDTPRSA
ncbi:MAG: carboxypeptidase regulatory-like domain-containing protein [Planctomycetes bacterium]|nr:carboxypeptidase regulatory-like domain-containing protein [Planctomycetota bacterium]